LKIDQTSINANPDIVDVVVATAGIILPDIFFVLIRSAGGT
jgi:hypothetical protein